MHGRTSSRRKEKRAIGRRESRERKGSSGGAVIALKHGKSDSFCADRLIDQISGLRFNAIDGYTGSNQLIDTHVVTREAANSGHHPIQPPEFARRIWIAAWQALGSACFAFANDRHDCALLGLLVLLTSLNYWRHPIHGWRRTVDIVAASGSLGYQIFFVAPYWHCPTAAIAYAFSVAMGVACYGRSRYLSHKYGDKDTSSWWHVGLHVCGNAGNFVLYDAVGSNLLGWSFVPDA